MRILYLHQFFMTRAGSGGTRSYEFARRLVEAGHEVTMVTRGRSHTADGIDVRGTGGPAGDYVADTAKGYGRRIAGFGGFAATATVAAARAPRPDVVFATSPPLSIAVPAIAAAARHRAPLVFEVRDLWPEAAIQMGALNSRVAIAAARRLERAAYTHAAHVVALSPGMRDGVIAAGTDPARITLIPNAADLDLFDPAADGGGLRTELGLERRFVAAYIGTMGEANDVGQVLEAAALLRDRGEERVAFVLQGDGKQRLAVERAVTERGLANVLLLPAGDKASAARLAAASDACMTIFKDVPILATNSPNKLFDTFAAGRAAIVNTGGWQRELVERHGAGVFAAPGDPAALADRVAELAADPGRTRAMGAAGRTLAEAEFGRDMLAERLRGVLEAAAR